MRTDLNDLLELVIQDKGGTPQEYNNLMNQIAYHETGPLQRMNPQAVQEGGGPGRGLFQFEIGDNKGGNTAVNRTYNYLVSSKAEVPEWLYNIWEGTKSVDASKLSDEKQRMLFLGNYMGHPKANFADVMSGGMNTKQFWANYHWAGKQDDMEVRMKSFEESLNSLRDTNNNQVAPFMHSVFGEKKSSLVDSLINK